MKIYMFTILLIISSLQTDAFGTLAIEKKDVSQALAPLEAQVQKELHMLNIPACAWLQPAMTADGPEILDVAIIGGGMSGLSISLALIKEGISNIKIFDKNASGKEGPWARYARMNVLRSDKTDLGPALGIPSLTFWAWYEAIYGQESWNKLKFAPTHLWNSYLCWFKQVLNLPMENNIELQNIIPLHEVMKLVFDKDGKEKIVYARKVVLATGRDGAGKVEIPQYMEHLLPHHYAHTAEHIDIEALANKKIAIIGGGASAFDAAATALEHGAQSVDMLIRRKELPQANKSTPLVKPGGGIGFYYLENQERWISFGAWMKHGTPPPNETLERVKHYQNLKVNYSTHIHKIENDDTSITLFTNKGELIVDFIIVATGFGVDLSQRPELANIHKDILLWKACVPPELSAANNALGRFPYLGPHFEFLEAHPDCAAYLKNIYCFNYGAFLSHGLLSGDIGLNSLGATRLAEGILIDFFLENCRVRP